MRPFNHTVRWLFPLLALLGSAVGGRATDFRVIANQSVPVSSLSSDDLKNIFLGTKTALQDGSHVEPALLQSGAVHEAFARQLIGKTGFALEAYYRSLVFTGRGLMPKTLSSDADMVRHVAKTRGAVGYVSAETSLTGVKALGVE